MPSPWARRLLEDNDHVAKATVDSTLGDRVKADSLIEITGSDTAWGEEIDRPTHTHPTEQFINGQPVNVPCYRAH